jgi:hypothetical protein
VEPLLVCVELLEPERAEPLLVSVELLPPEPQEGEYAAQASNKITSAKVASRDSHGLRIPTVALWASLTRGIIPRSACPDRIPDLNLVEQIERRRSVH